MKSRTVGLVLAILAAGAWASAGESGTAPPIVVRHAGEPGRVAVFDVGDTIEVVVSPTGVAPDSALTVRWVDSYERLVAEEARPPGSDGRTTVRFPVRACVSTGNSIKVFAGERVVGEVRFGCAPQHTRPLRDWYVFPWAQYPVGTGDTLRAVGVNGGMAYRNQPFPALVANDLRFYVDNMAHPIFAFYLKNRQVFAEQRDAFQKEWTEKGVANKSHLVRKPCLSDPETMPRMREMLHDIVRTHAPYKPVWYNMQDEGGLAWMNVANEFCYGPHCLASLREWLKVQYGSLEALNGAWGTAFAAWDDVVPMTSQEMRRREKDVPLAQKRLGPWCDHRASMDLVMTRALAKARDFCREVDPDGLFGMTGTQDPSPWSGFDYSLVPTAVDIAHYYDYGNAIEIARSLHPRRASRLFPYPGWSRGNVRIREDWYYLFHGLGATGMWDKEMELLDAEGRPTQKVLELKDTWLELQRGIGRLFISARRQDDPIAVHFSQPSLRVWAMVRDDPALAGVSFAWDATGAIRALEDLGLQYEFVAHREVEEGLLTPERWRLLFLLNAIALSGREAAAIEAWVEKGGVLVTDGRAGLFDEHGRGRAAPALAHLTSGKSIQEAAAGFDVFERGKGKVVRLKAVPLGAYPRERITGGASVEPVKAAAGAIVGLAGLSAQIPVRDEAGRPAHGVETVLFEDGAARYVAVFRNNGYDGRLARSMGQAFTQAFAEPMPITVHFDGPMTASRRSLSAEVYDIRAGKHLGWVKAVKATLGPWEPLCYALLPYRLNEIAVAGPARAGRGSPVPVRFTLKGTAAPGGATFARHVLRVEVFGPDGALRTHYSRNLDTEKGAAQMTIPLALNDALGAWRLRVRDVATGVSAEHSFQVDSRVD